MSATNHLRSEDAQQSLHGQLSTRQSAPSSGLARLLKLRVGETSILLRSCCLAAALLLIPLAAKPQSAAPSKAVVARNTNVFSLMQQRGEADKIARLLNKASTA